MKKTYESHPAIKPLVKTKPVDIAESGGRLHHHPGRNADRPVDRGRDRADDHLLRAAPDLSYGIGWRMGINLNRHQH